MVKKILVGAVVLGLAFTVSVSSASADSLAVAVDLTKVKVCNFNMGWVNNFVFTGSNSGWNTTWSGPSSTGNAAATTTVGTNLNSNSTGVMIWSTGGGPVAVNIGDDKGPFAGFCSGCFDPIAIAADLTLVKVSNFNMGGVLNLVGTGANTGLNMTGGGKSSTGNATANATVGSVVNSNNTEVYVCDFEQGPVALNWEPDFFFVGESNDSHSLALAVDLTGVKVSNFNAGMVINGIGTWANTGVNLTFGGKSSTGNATAKATVGTTLNTSSTTVGIVEGGMGPVAVNLNSGSLAVALEAELVKVSNTNLGYVGNFVSTKANTGRNRTFGGKSSTGNATAKATVGNVVNSNTTEVGIIDTSSGPIAVNADAGSICTPPSLCDAVEPDCVGDGCGGIDGAGGPVAANIGTDGVAVAADVDAVKVTNTNVASVTNNVDTTANTGGNSTGGLVGPPGPPCLPADVSVEGGGGTSSETGNASATTTVSNTVNTNSTTVVIVD